MSQKKESDKSKRKSNMDGMKGAKDGKSENTVTTKKGSKDTEPKLNSGNIPAESGSIKGDGSADDREEAVQDNLNDDSHAAEGQSQDIDTQQDSAYRSENDTDTLHERSESTALDETERFGILILKKNNKKIVT